jgi:hypothetical protein
MPKQLLLRFVSFALSSFVATLFFGHTREMATNDFNVGYVGSI